MGDRHESKRERGAALALALAAVALLAAGAATPSAAQPELPDYEAACEGENPYLVTVCHAQELFLGAQDAAWPALVMFNDTPGNEPHYNLATQADIGAVWGLGYSAPQAAVYAAAYHKRQRPFGPGGPGAIYRIDLTSGGITQWATVPDAGEDRHAGMPFRGDRQAAEWVGKTSLGDLDVNAGAGELYVANLHDRRIYRFGLDDAHLRGSFPHGAAGEPWADDARPFGIAVQGERLLHGVVNSAESSQRPQDLEARVYASRPDGGDMRLVASFRLDYPRGGFERPRTDPLDWRPWRIRRTPFERVPRVYFTNPMPMLTDLAVDRQGRLVVGLRDRQTDAAEIYVRTETPSIGIGDLLWGEVDGDGWVIDPRREHFYDDTVYGAESSLGGLAAIPRLGQVAVSSAGIEGQHRFTLFPSAGTLWYDADSGAKLREESLCEQLRFAPTPSSWSNAAPRRAEGPSPRRRLDNEAPPDFQKGDVELLCARPTPSPTPVPKPTVSATPSRTPTRTPTPSATPSASPSPSGTPTPTPTALPRPLYLPLALREACTPDTQRIDVALVIDASSSMQERAADGRTKLQAAVAAVRVFLDALRLDAGDQAALVRFHADAALLQPLGADRAALDAALDGLAVGRSTCVVCGLEAADEELAGPRRDPDNLPVLILLTDGRSNPRPVSEAVARAQEAKARGLLIFAIGLGSDLEVDALRAIASGPGRYYHAPGADALEGIYRQIAVAIPCPDDAFWPVAGGATRPREP